MYEYLTYAYALAQNRVERADRQLFPNLQTEPGMKRKLASSFGGLMLLLATVACGGGGIGGGRSSEAAPTPIGANLSDEAFTHCIEGGVGATVLTTPGVDPYEIVIIRDRRGRIVYRGLAANAPSLPYNLGPQALGPTGRSDGAYLWRYEDQLVYSVCQSQ